MQTAEYDVNSFGHNAQHEEDKKLLVKFLVKPRQDRAASAIEGRPIFKDTEYVDIRIPGDRTGGVSRPASYGDKQRFAAHYAAFRARTEVPLEGTPLAEWPLITRALAEELAFHNVKTVEQLSTMADVHSGKFMGLNSLKAKALKWLEQASEEAKVHELQDALAERDERITVMEGQIAQLLASQTAEVSPEAAAATLAVAPSLTSELDEPVVEEAPKATPRRRRKRKVTDDGAVQNDK